MKRLLCTLALVAFAAAPALADPRSDVMAAMVSFAKATSFHMTATSHGKTLEGDFALPQKMHITAGPFEMIEIDKTTWVKTGGAWRQFSMPGMTRMTGMFTGAIDTARSHPDDLVVTDLGMKSPGGLPLHAYSIANKAGKSPSTVYLDGSGTLVRVDGADGSYVTFSNFNAPVSIEPPS